MAHLSSMLPFLYMQEQPFPACHCSNSWPGLRAKSGGVGLSGRAGKEVSRPWFVLEDLDFQIMSSNPMWFRSKWICHSTSVDQIHLGSVALLEGHDSTHCACVCQGSLPILVLPNNSLRDWPQRTESLHSKYTLPHAESHEAITTEETRGSSSPFACCWSTESGHGSCCSFSLLASFALAKSGTLS